MTNIFPLLKLKTWILKAKSRCNTSNSSKLASYTMLCLLDESSFDELFSWICLNRRRLTLKCTKYPNKLIAEFKITFGGIRVAHCLG
jgi:hypothetical protein